MKKNEQELLKDLVSDQESQELDVRELLEVQGGIDSDEDLDSCISRQCSSGAVKYCNSGA